MHLYFILFERSFSSSSGIFPTPDYALIENEGMDFFLLPLILYLIAVGIFWVLSLVVAVSLILCESTVQKFAVK